LGLSGLGRKRDQGDYNKNNLSQSDLALEYFHRSDSPISNPIYLSNVTKKRYNGNKPKIKNAARK
jgi:hypothetical protein